MRPTSEPTPAAAGRSAAASTLRARTFVCMGTVVSLTVPVQPDCLQADLDELDAATAVVERQFEALDAQFSLYRPTSEASRIGRGELRLMDASRLMRDLYADAVRWRRRTDGAFTPERPDGALDLSGIVKGYAIAEAGGSLAALGMHAWCLNAGGDVLVSGSPTGSTAWLAGIVDPADRRTILGAYPLGGSDSIGPGSARRALATSGTAERGEHIWAAGLRPSSWPGRTGSRSGFAQVSVAAADIVTADVLATAIVAGGHGTLDEVIARWDVDVLTVEHDGGLLATRGFRALHTA